MEFPKYKQLVAETRTGKQLPDAVYLHESAIGGISESLATLALRIADALKISDDEWNILKLYRRDFKLAFLNYPTFETDSYPALRHSFTVDLTELSMRRAEYDPSKNPPILHRKETFVPDTYPLRARFAAITAEGEAIGLYENPRSIGFKRNWERLISNKGYYLDEEGRLQPKANAETTEDPPDEDEIHDAEIERHKTAIDRNQLSQPMQVLARHDYLNGDWSILDYGCGKGDDIRELEAHGIDCMGWDPVHRPDVDIVPSDIVNLGFVLNVIEDRAERDETLTRAWEHAEKLLIASVMIAGDTTISQFRPYKDGVVTSRKTFQKYYAQSEFRSYIETTLDDNAVAVGQGIFIIFKDKLLEQEFLVARQHINRDWRQKTQREIQQREPSIKKGLIDRHIDVFTDFWDTSLELGRVPANSEFEFSEQIRRVAGSHSKAHQALAEHFGSSLFQEAQTKRKEDLLVYFALGLFEKRKPQTQMPESLRRDIKAFFTSYNDAIEIAQKLLFSVGSPAVIQESCEQAYAKLQCGEMNEGHSFIFHKQYLGALPPTLRVYIGCATQLYGDLENIQLIKAHIRSGKVSLMGYKDWNSDIPMLTERVKIKMREQDVDFFDYVGKFSPPPLNNKEIYFFSPTIL